MKNLPPVTTVHGDKPKYSPPHPLYQMWISMKARCYNPKHTRYEYYGAIGVKVCDDWKHDYLAFKNWALVNGWKPGLSIERLDIARGYCPENCCFIPKKMQTYNRRNPSCNTTGVRGVTEYLPGRFRARIRFNGKRTSVGCFDTAEQAGRARDRFIIDNDLPHILSFPLEPAK